MRSRATRFADRLLISYNKLVFVMLWVAIAAGCVFIVLVIADYVAFIDMGSFLEDVHPLLRIGGGIAVIFGAAMHFGTVKKQNEKAAARLAADKKSLPLKSETLLKKRTSGPL